MSSERPHSLRAIRRSAAAVLLVWALFSLGRPEARAHESWPALLEIREKPGDQLELLWRTPLTAGVRSPIGLQLPDTWRPVGTATEREQDRWIVRRFAVAAAPESIDGATLEFPRQEATITDVHVRLFRADGTVFSTVVRPTYPRVQLRGERPWSVNMREYVALGFHHITLGVDHLLFVLGLLLIVRGRGMLLKTITAFTVAHSLTLAVATLGFASVPLEPLNAAIALSILFLGPEVVRSWHGGTSLTIRYPWIVAFAFGLLHGFGFATGLSTAGVPAGELPWALLFFNVGVELGQLAFVGVCFALVRAWRTLEVAWPAWAMRVPGYVVGVCGAYWTIQRVVLMLA